MSSLGYLFYEPIVQLPTNVSTHGVNPQMNGCWSLILTFMQSVLLCFLL